MTILMGVVGRYPFALATGLGINAVVAVYAATQLSWPEIMGLVVLEGLLITVLVLTGFRKAVFAAIPPQLKTAIAVGIGFFLTIIGLADAGVIRPGSPLITFGVGGQLAGWPLFVFVFGLLLMAVLVVRKVKGALLIGIVATTLLAIVIEAIADIGPRIGDDNPHGWALQVPKLPDDVVDGPDLSLIGNFSLFGGFERIGIIAALLIVFSIMIADFFDTVGTVTAVGAEGDLLDEDRNLPKSQPVLLIDSLAAAAGGAGSVSSNTTYIESTAGVADGARTGLASVLTGLLFLVAMFFTPLVQMVPSEAAAPALVIVGALMITPDPLPGLGRHVPGDPGVPHHRADAVHLLDHQWHRGRRRQLRAAPPGRGPSSRHPPADVGDRHRVRRLLRAGAHPAARLRAERSLGRLRIVPRTTLDTAALAHDLRLAVMRFSRRLRNQRVDTSVTLTHLSALSTLKQHGSMSPGELAGHERVQPPSMTRVVVALEGMGLLTRSPHPTDGRQVVIDLTPAAVELLLAEAQAREAWLTGELAGLTDEERATLREASTIMEKLAGR